MAKSRQQRKLRKKRNEQRKIQMLQNKGDGTRIRSFFKMKERSGDAAEFDLEFSGRPVEVDNPETDDLEAKDALAKAVFAAASKQVH